MTPQEELLVLRSLVEKQKEELVAKDEIIEKQSIHIENIIQVLLSCPQKAVWPLYRSYKADRRAALSF